MFPDLCVFFSKKYTCIEKFFTMVICCSGRHFGEQTKKCCLNI